MSASLLSKSLHLKKSELQFILFFCLRNKEFVLFHHVQDQFWLQYNNYTMPGKSYHSKGIILLFLNNLQYFPIIPPRHRHYSPFQDVIILLYRNLCNTDSLRSVTLTHWQSVTLTHYSRGTFVNLHWQCALLAFCKKTNKTVQLLIYQKWLNKSLSECTLTFITKSWIKTLTHDLMCKLSQTLKFSQTSNVCTMLCTSNV